MKMIDVDYSVRVGYCASRNNMQEYKMYVIVIEMFSPNFVNNLWQAPWDNPWLAKPTNYNCKTRLLHQAKYLLGMNKLDQYSLEET
jgi:hypothetical protein